MKVLTVFARRGYRLDTPLFLPNGEFLPEGTALTDEHLHSLRSAKVKVLELEADARIRDWECVPDLNAFMATIAQRFTTDESDETVDLIRCAVEDVYTRFLFDLETEK